MWAQLVKFFQTIPKNIFLLQLVRNNFIFPEFTLIQHSLDICCLDIETNCISIFNCHVSDPFQKGLIFVCMSIKAFIEMLVYLLKSFYLLHVLQYILADRAQARICDYLLFFFSHSYNSFVYAYDTNMPNGWSKT